MNSYGLVKSAFSWPGRGRSAFGGWTIVGPKANRAVLTFGLISIPGGFFLAIPAWERWQKDDYYWIFPLGLALLVATLALETLVALSNPGFIPCQNPPYSLGPLGSVPLSFLNSCPQKYIEIAVNGALVRMKYCHSCSLFRPPRTSHCGKCGVCVERFDHHCPWVGKCIGKRNYNLFLLFITTLACTEAYIWAVCLANILIKVDTWGAERLVKEKIPEIVIGSYSFCVNSTQLFFFSGSLTLFHFLIISQNQTTYERLKKTWELRGQNPYDRGTFYENCGDVLAPLASPPRYDLRELVDLSSMVITRSMRAKLFYPLDLRTLPSDNSPSKKYVDVETAETQIMQDTTSTTGGTREGLRTTAIISPIK
jgi:palmitoyltransferase ZDHHC9/14/18